MKRGGDGVPVSKATLKYYRCSPQKARLVADQIRGLDVNGAMSLLQLSPKAVARPMEKLLRSVVANAEAGEERIDVDTLYVGEVFVGQGPTFKRFRGRAFGRAFMILHRTCHITIKLFGPRGETAPAQASATVSGT
ncbi:MAG: 50S ribosomal protein L22 [Acidobacteriota bacterium]